MMTALLLIPIAIAAGMSLDYANVMRQKTMFQAAADAAAVGALSTQSPAVLAAIKMTNDGSVALGEQDAKRLFNGQLSTSSLTELSNLSISVNKTGSQMQSVVKYTINVPTTFAGLVGMAKIAASGSATAIYNTGSFLDFYMLLDNTPSMGVGATADDIAKLERYTPDSCAFACHDLSNPNDYYNIAKNNGVQMRIDVVRQATQELTQKAKSDARYPNQYQMGVYTFGDSATNPGLKEISGLSSNMDQVSKDANGIDLMTIPWQGYNDDQVTDFNSVLKDLNAKISKVGAGTSAVDRQPIIYFVSDGVTDAALGNSCTKKTTNGTRCQQPIDYTKMCSTLKKRGVKIAVLYTTYLPIPKNSWYNYWIAPFQSQIGDSMKGCASPGLYFEVSPSQGISDAMKALFNIVVNTPRISG